VTNVTVPSAPLSTQAPAQRVGIVDMGSGSARLVVYQFQSGNWFRLTDEIRESVRLGEGFASSGKLSNDAITRALDALKLYTDYASATGLGKLTVIATSAVREAANSKEFLKKLRGFDLEFIVLSGEDEARYGALAVANSFSVSDAWVMDLGGGSAQLSKLEKRLFALGAAYPLGYVRLTEQFLKGDRTSDSEVRDLERFVKTQMGRALDSVKRQPAPLIAMGGTIRNLARAVQKADDYPLDQLHGYELTRDKLETLIDRLLELPASERSRISGIHPDRADAILGGALVYRTVLRECDLNSLYISGQGVREGAFYRSFIPHLPHLLPEVRSFSVLNLFAHYPQELPHTHHVRKLSRRLFETLEPLHGYGGAEAQLLDAAAMLHDIGMAVNYFDHHKHSAYLILSSQMPGLTHREHVLLALLTQYHRKGDPKLGVYRTLLQPDDDLRLTRLAACLRLAEYLERARAGRVKDIEVSIKRDTVTLRLKALETPRVELWEAAKQGALFRKAFGKELILEADDLKISAQDSRLSTPEGKTKRKKH
jgi:exopolyphosphatase / guanosine-5'-triphosphate,3'-diphosphate pyrophosphatase